MPEEVVLVTGVSGYIASHVAKLLLEEGYRVKGTVRSLANAAKTDPLKSLVPDAKFPLELVETDLTKDEGWVKAMEDVTSLIHMASPFPNFDANVKEEDLVTPATEGTLRVLKAAVAAKIKKVVLTSSIVSIFAESVPENDKVYTEEDWTNPESPTIDSYAKSKVLAEKVAWDYLKELPDEEKFTLSVINPSFVLGPVLMESHKDATSPNFLTQMLNKAYPAVPRMSLNICDVRDVAKAHVKALSTPEAEGKRHIILTRNFWFKDVATILAQEFQPQGYSIPTAQLPYFVCWIAALFNKQMKSYVLPRIGKRFYLENKRMVEVLGIEPTAPESTIKDMAYSLIELGIVKKAKNYGKTPVSKDTSAPVVEGEKTAPIVEGEKTKVVEEKKAAPVVEEEEKKTAPVVEEEKKTAPVAEEKTPQVENKESERDENPEKCEDKMENDVKDQN